MKPRYVDVRIEQLKEEVAKMTEAARWRDSESMEIQWYNRLIQELEWVSLMQDKEGDT
jgi:hypothetical protein